MYPPCYEVDTLIGRTNIVRWRTALTNQGILTVWFTTMKVTEIRGKVTRWDKRVVQTTEIGTLSVDKRSRVPWVNIQTSSLVERAVVQPNCMVSTCSMAETVRKWLCLLETVVLSLQSNVENTPTKYEILVLGLPSFLPTVFSSCAMFPSELSSSISRRKAPLILQVVLFRAGRSYACLGNTSQLFHRYPNVFIMQLFQWDNETFMKRTIFMERHAD